MKLFSGLIIVSKNIYVNYNPKNFISKYFLYFQLTCSSTYLINYADELLVSATDHTQLPVYNVFMWATTLQKAQF